jgi:DNA-binding NarL/FixJ family response regulator
MSGTRIFIVDDHDLFRAGVRAELPDDLQVVGDASNVEAAIEMIRERKPDLVLVDVHMPNGGGRAVIEGVHTTNPDVRFLAISASDAPEDVVATVRAGARGYVTKTVSPADLGEAIRRVVDGDAVFSPKLAGFVLDAFASMGVKDLNPELDKLTKREREVLQHIARGYTYREVGEQLFISAKTVENHMSAVLRKLQLSNRRELTRWAQDRDLI